MCLQKPIKMWSNVLPFLGISFRTQILFLEAQILFVLWLQFFQKSSWHGLSVDGRFRLQQHLGTIMCYFLFSQMKSTYSITEDGTKNRYFFYLFLSLTHYFSFTVISYLLGSNNTREMANKKLIVKSIPRNLCLNIENKTQDIILKKK